jgi:serine/threonine protein kinase/WD40 repeat protein
MKAGDWDRIERICHEAGALDPAERRAFLDRICADDPDVRREVESLLDFQTSAEPVLVRSALQETAALIDPSEFEPAPQIPGYTILELIGEGGMGVVYLAEQDAPLQRRVALKLIKPGMDSRRVVERFESERQALARMDHPNIAMVFDAGTTDDGRPFFVMEFVSGVPITEYCDRQRLSTSERLELFLHVCAAVQHAHQKGVIHRDLKPSNVLVSSEEGDARPKVIDFGIAKAVQPPVGAHGGVTEQGTLVGTPEYMSPEQAAFSPDIDTTSDVYTLGVLLYELLVGTLPFDSKVIRAAGPDEWRRVIRENDPPRPSTRLTGGGADSHAIAAARKTDAGRLSRDLRGDLDWIVLKALEKDRRRRYATAAALAADVERYLASQPVEARPPSAVYRLRKFTRRYRGAVAAAAVILLVLLAGFGTTLVQFVRAERARAEAERAREQANRERAQADVHRQAAEVATLEATVRRRDAERATDEANRAQKAATREAEAAEGARREAEYRTYVATIAAADGELRAGLAQSARQRLLAVPADRRGWEWEHFFLKSDASVLTLESKVPCTTSAATRGGPLKQGASTLPMSGSVIWTSAQAVVLGADGNHVSFRRCDKLEGWDIAARTMAITRAAGPILATGAAGRMLVASEASPWELQLFAGGSSASSTKFAPFEAQPTCAAVSPDGTRVAVGLMPRMSDRGWLLEDIFEIWDAQAPRRIARMVPLKPPEDTRIAPACHVVFSPDGRTLASSGATVFVWDATTGGELRADSVQAGTVSQPIAFSADGSRLAIGRRTGLVDVLYLDGSRRTEQLNGNGFIKDMPLPEADRYTLVGSRKKNEVLSIAFSPDGNRVVTGTDQHVGVWDLTQRLLTAVLSGHPEKVIGLAVAPDGRIFSGDASGTVKMWPRDAANGVAVLPGAFSIPDRGLAVAANGSVAAVSQTDGGLQTWRLSDLQSTILRRGTGQRDGFKQVRSLALAPDGSRLLVGEYDAVGTVTAIGIPSGERVAALPGQASYEPGCFLPNPSSTSGYNPVFALTVSPDGRAIAHQHGTCLIVRDLNSFAVLATLHERPTGFAFRPDGLLMVSSQVPATPGQPAPSSFRIWDWRNNRTIARVPAPWCPRSSATIWRLALSADGRTVAFYASAAYVSCVFISNGALTRELGRLPVPPDIDHVALSADGTRIAMTTRNDTTVHVWDLTRRRPLLVLGDDDTHQGGIAFTPDGRLVATRSSGGLTVWQTRKPACPVCASERD